MLLAGYGPSGGESAGAARFRTGGTSSAGGQVYMGSKQVRLEGMGYRTRDQYVPTSVAKEEFSHWSDKKRNDFISAGLISGLLGKDDGTMEARKKWEALVEESAKFAAAGKKVRPWDILASYVSAAGGMKGRWVRQGDFEINTATGEKRYVGPHFKTTTQERVDLTDPATARAIATKMFQDLMGRNPGKGEIGTFAGALTQAERDNPLVETTTTEFDMGSGEPVGSKSTSTGGVGAEGKQLLAEEQIKRKKEYGTLQAVTTYQNALDNTVYGAPE